MPPVLESGPFIFSSGQVTAWVGSFLLPFFRIGALFMVMPIFGTHSVPIRIRMGLTIVVTVLIAPLLPALPPLDPLSLKMAFSVSKQMLIGAAMGFVLRLIFTAAELGGQVVGQLMGLGFASLMDPQNGVPVAIVSQFYSLLVTLVYLSLDGHLLALWALVDSFKRLPLDAIGPSPETWWDVTVWTGVILQGALLIALPAIGALLLVNLTFAVITRAAPALNLFAVGFPITLGLGLLIIMYTLPTLAIQIDHLLREAIEVTYGLPLAIKH